MRSLFRNRLVRLSLGVLVVAVVAYGVWSFAFPSGPKSGPGAYGYELSSCQDNVFADLMEPTDLEWAAGTEWHDAAGTNVHVGGKFTRVDTRTGKRKGFAYDCAVRNRQVLNANVN